MKEYKLTTKDLAIIKYIALQLWLDNAVKNEYFMVECYTKAFISYAERYKLRLINGKLYEENKEQE